LLLLLESQFTELTCCLLGKKKEERKTSISSIEIFSLNSKEQYDLELFAHHQSYSCHEIISKGKGDHNSAPL
jgi:hypothetical protein